MKIVQIYAERSSRAMTPTETLSGGSSSPLHSQKLATTYMVNCRGLTGLTTPVGLTAVTPTDRPKLVRNRCVIEVFGGVFMLSRCFLDFSVGEGVFIIGLSHISSFFS